MDTELRKAGYRLDAHTGVFKKPEFTGIQYSDGDDAERRIESIIQNASDLSTFSPELRVHCTDWVSTYHLSRSRSNILRPFNLSGEQKILEIGSGNGENIIKLEIPTGNPLHIIFGNNLEVKDYKYLDNKRAKKILFNV